MWNGKRRKEEDPRIGFCIQIIEEKKKKERKKLNERCMEYAIYRECHKSCEWRKEKWDKFLSNLVVSFSLSLFLSLSLSLSLSQRFSSTGKRNTFWCIWKRLEKRKNCKPNFFSSFFEKKKKEQKISLYVLLLFRCSILRKWKRITNECWIEI